MKIEQFFNNNNRTTTTTEAPATEAFLVCADDTCYDPALIEDDEVPDLKVAASARLPDDNLRLIFEQMAQRQTQENSDDKVRSLLEAAKVTEDEEVIPVDNDVDKDLENVDSESLDEQDKSSSSLSSAPSSSSLFKPVDARPKLIPKRPPGKIFLNSNRNKLHQVRVFN